MKRVITVVALVGVSVMLLGAGSLAAVRARAMSPVARVFTRASTITRCASAWRVVPSPNASNFANSGLWGVAAISRSDAWAVGVSGDQRSGGQTLAEQWDGTQWRIVASPSPGGRYAILYSVAAVSATDVWAVGFYGNSTGGTESLIERWNGASWSVVPSPNPAAINNELFSVAVVSASDIWAVGFISIPGPNYSATDETLVEHWNGAVWRVVPSPNPLLVSDHLEGVTALSSHDVWAVGTGGATGQTLAEHWNGTRWTVVPSATPAAGGDLRDVAADSSSDVWAVGYDVPASGSQTLAERWNGTSWQVVTTPSATAPNPALSGVAAISPLDVWAVGSTFDVSAFYFGTLIERWDGAHWQIVPSPNSPTGSSQLIAVAADTTVVSPDVWAVGHGVNVTLIEHYSCQWPA